MEIVDLPHDLFLLIVAHLSARTTVRCRRVSRRWRAAFADPDLSLQLLKWHFPRSREMRMAYAATGLFGAPPGTRRGGRSSPTDEMVAVGADGGDGDGDGDGNGNGHMTPEDDDYDDYDWTAVFTLVARRYHHLRTATPRALDKIRLGTTPTTAAATAGPEDRFYGVATWDRYLRLNDKTAPFHYPDPSWCYGREEGVLVYHAHPDDEVDVDVDVDAPGEAEGVVGGARPAARAYVYPWRLLDLESGEAVEVPFPHDDDRIVRRVRLAEGVLVFEWCERVAYHQLNDREECHRHWATVLDVVRTPKPTSTPSPSSSPSSSTTARSSSNTTWTITPRTEFKFHFLGLPLNTHDRFLSAHTATRYAVYVWQPNRSPWGEDDPIESALVWDISSSSSASASSSSSSSSSSPSPRPPRVVRRLPMAALAFYGVRQRAAPRLRGLALDERNLYLVEEEHRWARGSHSSLSPPRVHLVRSTGIPVVPFDTTPAEGEGEEGKGDDGAGGDTDADDGVGEVIVQGPRWLDECGANGDVNLSFCSRAAAAAPRLHMSAAGAAAASTTTTTPHALPYMCGHILAPNIRPGMIWDTNTHTHHNNNSNDTNPGTMAGGAGAALSSSSSSYLSPSSPFPRTTLAQELAAAASAAGGRWPGWAPCWRHEEFPYLTVGEMVDFRAGVRVTARHCFMLETLSVHVRPSLAVRGLLLGGARDGDGGDGRERGNVSSSSSSSSTSPSLSSLGSGMGLRRGGGLRQRPEGTLVGESDGGIDARVGDRLKAGGRSTGAGGAEGGAKEGRRRDRAEEEEEEEGGDEEVQFPDEMWDEVVGKGFICGDERWLIGEDKRGRITIVRF